MRPTAVPSLDFTGPSREEPAEHCRAAPRRVISSTVDPDDFDDYVRDVERVAMVKVINKSVRDSGWNEIGLTVDLDGTLLLSSSNTAKNTHAVIRIGVEGTPTPLGLMTGSRTLAVPVLVDGAGYGMALRRTANRERVSLYRHSALSLSATTWTQIGSYL